MIKYCVTNWLTRRTTSVFSTTHSCGRQHLHRSLFSSVSSTDKFKNRLDSTKAMDAVSLLWERSTSIDPNDNLTYKVYLGPVEDTSYSQTVSPTVDIEEENDIDTPHSSDVKVDSSSAIPQSVLQYERQRRKAQHFKKAGAILSSDSLQVLYHDDAIVVANKPPGVLTVPGVNTNSCLLDLVHEEFGQSCSDKTNMIVHRLDMDTSGIVVFARTPDIAKKLHTIFRDRHVHKGYEALVQGHLPVDRIDIHLPLQRDHAHPPFWRVSTPASETAALAALKDLHRHGYKTLIRKAPKPSETRLHVISREWYDGQKLPMTRLRLEPITGRTHQLRIHCAALGFPIVGDPAYGLYGEAAPKGGLQLLPSFWKFNDQLPQPFTEGPDLDLLKQWTASYVPNDQPMCLHAALLRMEHPSSGVEMVWEIPPNF